MARDGLPFTEALAVVRAARPLAQPNAAFGAELSALGRRGELVLPEVVSEETPKNAALDRGILQETADLRG